MFIQYRNNTYYYYIILTTIENKEKYEKTYSFNICNMVIPFSIFDHKHSYIVRSFEQKRCNKSFA